MTANRVERRRPSAQRPRLAEAQLPHRPRPSGAVVARLTALVALAAGVAAVSTAMLRAGDRSSTALPAVEAAPEQSPAANWRLTVQPEPEVLYDGLFLGLRFTLRYEGDGPAKVSPAPGTFCTVCRVKLTSKGKAETLPSSFSPPEPVSPGQEFVWRQQVEGVVGRSPAGAERGQGNRTKLGEPIVGPERTY